MIKLGGIISGTGFVREAADDKYVHVAFGNYKEKGKEKDPNAPTYKKDDSGKFVPTKGDNAAKGGDSSAGETKPKVNIFDKPSPEDEPKSDTPKDSTNSRPGDPETNKYTRTLAKKAGLTPSKLGKEEYQKKMVQAAYSALVDSNFSDEARKLVATIENKPELAKSVDWSKGPSMSDPDFKTKNQEFLKNTAYGSEYANADEDADDFGRNISNKSGWDGQQAVDAIAFDLKMNGFKNLASKVQSIFEGKVNSTKLKDIIGNTKKMNESSHEEMENKVDEMFNDIREGSGWTTADYITNSAHVNLSERERAQLLFKLAEGGMLVDETTLKGTERELNELDETSFMSIQDVKSKYHEIKSRYDKEDVNESVSKSDFAVRMLSDYANVRDSHIVDFINKHNLDPKKIENSFVQKGKKIDAKIWFSALVGNPGNKYQKMVISKFGNSNESINENPYMQAAIRNQMVQNPVTKKKVKVTTAASNPNHPAHKKAKSILQKIMDKIKKK